MGNECRNCRYYVPHYVKIRDGKNLILSGYGHCIKGRPKMKKIMNRACVDWMYSEKLRKEFYKASRIIHKGSKRPNAQ